MPSPLLDPKTEPLVQSQLQPGETVQWSSSALAKRLLVRAVPTAITSAAIVGFLAAAFYASIGADLPSRCGLLVFGLIPLAAGLVLLWTARRAKRIAYVVTNQRAFILEPKAAGAARVRSFPSSALGPAVKVLRPDGSGDVILGTVIFRGAKGRSGKRLAGFFGLPEPELPFGIITALAKTAAQLPPEVAPQRFSFAQFLPPLLLIAISCALIIPSFKNLPYARQSATWPTTPGKVITSTVVLDHGARRARYQARIFYEYHVGDWVFSSSRISLGDNFSTQKHARALVAQYPQGSQVTVFYDPNNPGSSVLHPGLGAMAWLLLVYVAMLWSVAISLAWSQFLNNWPKQK